MPMNKIKIELNIGDIASLLREVFQAEYPEYEITSVMYKMTDAGFERNQPYGHKFTGIEVNLEK